MIVRLFLIAKGRNGLSRNGLTKKPVLPRSSSRARPAVVAFSRERSRFVSPAAAHRIAILVEAICCSSCAE